MGSIEDFCKETGNKLIVFPVVHQENASRYDFQYDANLGFINSQNIDVLLLASGTLINFISVKQYVEQISSLNPVPLVSIGIELPEIPSVVTHTDDALEESIEHLITVHNRKRFMLFHADNRNEESVRREAVFRKVLKKHNIKFDEEKSFNGNYDHAYAYTVLKNYIKKKEQLDFDGIFCCNDNMALGCIAALVEKGFSVPDDVSIVGFDNTGFASSSEINLTTIDQQIGKQARTAAEIAVKIFAKQDVLLLTKIDGTIVYRHSCGCCQRGSKNKSEPRNQNLIKDIQDRSGYQFYLMHYFFQEAQEPVPLEKLDSRLEYSFNLFDIKQAQIVLYNKPVYYGQGKQFSIPEKASYFLSFTPKSGVKKFNLSFNPNDYMLPIEGEKILGTTQMIFPLPSEYNLYGYMIFTFGRYDKIFYQTIHEMLAKEIIAAIKISKTEEESRNLKNKNLTLSEYSQRLQKLSRTDEMTGIYNRRGFYEAAQELIDDSVAHGKKGLVIYGDMDGLKRINDTFGHDAGDRAIRQEAQILTEVFSIGDVVGRLGGDEFAIVTAGLTKKDFESIKKNIRKKCDAFNEAATESFILSMSVGEAEFGKKNSNLKTLLEKADKILYKEKQAKHKKNEKKVKLLKKSKLK